MSGGHTGHRGQHAIHWRTCNQPKDTADAKGSFQTSPQLPSTPLLPPSRAHRRDAAREPIGFVALLALRVSRVLRA